MQSVVIVMKEGSGTMQVGGWVEGSSFHLGVRGCSRYPSRDRRAPESKVEVANISYSGLACGASFQ